MRGSILVMAGLSLVLSACCGTNFKGSVRDLDTLEPIEGAVVSIEDINWKTRTNADGKFKFRGILCTTTPYTVRVSAPDYGETSEKYVFDGGVMEKNFSLKSASGAPAVIDDEPPIEDPPVEDPPVVEEPPPIEDDGDKVTCGDCDSEIPRGSNPCPACGTTRIGEEPRKVVKKPRKVKPKPKPKPRKVRPKPKKVPMTECPECEADIPKGSNPCPACGTSLVGEDPTPPSEDPPAEDPPPAKDPPAEDPPAEDPPSEETRECPNCEAPMPVNANSCPACGN